MPHYCEKFGLIESKIYDIAFLDRFNNFLKTLPSEAAMHIRNQVTIRSEDMEIFYPIGTAMGNQRANVETPRTQLPRQTSSALRQKVPQRKFVRIGYYSGKGFFG